MENYLASKTRYDNMQYRRVGNSGLKLSALSLGLWHNFGSVDPLENQRHLLRHAFDLGITCFDIANNYGPEAGSAESNFGRIFKADFQPYRDELVITSKAGYYMWPGPYGEWGSRKSIIASCDQSLRRTGLDYFDIFYSHRFDPDTPLEETALALDQLVKSGKALYVGISNYNAENTEKNCRDFQGFKDALHHPPGPLQHVRARSRERPVPDLAQGSHGRRCLQPTGTRNADWPVPARDPGRFPRRPQGQQVLARGRCGKQA